MGVMSSDKIESFDEKSERTVLNSSCTEIYDVSLLLISADILKNCHIHSAL